MAYWDRPAAAVFDPIEIKTRDSERLLALQSEIHPDGNAATVSLHFTNQSPFKVIVPYAEAGILLNEIRHTASLMGDRQRLKLDRGAEQLMEVAENAMHPISIDILVDPMTSDRIVLFQFSNHSPLAIRLAPDEVFEFMMDIQRVAKAAAH